ncbi:MAG: ATP-binding protein [Oscillospiraceae bacterium]
MAVRKLTRRWLLNSFGVIVTIVLLIEVVAGVAVQRYYYTQVQQELSSQALIVANTLGQYAQDSADPDDFAARLRGYVAGFEQKSQMELMVVDGQRAISLTSSGFLPSDTSLPDVDDALTTSIGQGEHTGQLGTSERVYAFAMTNPVPGQNDLLAIRLITSLSLVDRQITTMIAGMLLLGILVLAMVLFSSSYFLSSIIRPIGQVGETARRIAQGDFDARLQKRSNDEIGELCDVINYMAGELQTAEKLKNDFISSVSHELRTPLTAIQGWGETIRSDGGQDKELLDKGMTVIIGETGRLSDMVEDLLDFSRMQSGRLRLIKSRIDVMAELSEAVLMYTQRAEREGIDLQFEDTEEAIPVYGDKNRLRQVFINIIDNAVKYSDRGDSVTVRCRVEGQKVIITVADTGIGISQKDLPQVKAKFYKADTTRRGSGIGLAMAEEMVMRHDGTLDIESEEGAGTRITITLPLYQKQDDIAQIEQDEPADTDDD